MKVYKFKCDSCGSRKVVKVDDGYKCEYCGSVQDVIFQPTQPEIKTTEEKETCFHEVSSITNKQYSIFIRLILCLIVGYVGVHKFIERKIGLGLLYFFTGGLFGVGVIIDTISYILEIAGSREVKGDDE